MVRRIGWRLLPTLDGFPEITAIEILDQADALTKSVGHKRKGPVRVSGRSRALQRAAARVTSQYILVHQKEVPPPKAWIRAARDLLDDSSEVGCVTGAGTGQDPIPTFSLDPANMLIRRAILLESGGPSAAYQGVGDGIDLAWRLWAMGHQVLCLTLGNPASRPPAFPPIYLIQRNWLWTLIRNCGEADLSWVLSKVLLQIMAWAGQAAEGSDIVQPSAALQPTDREYIEEKIRLRDPIADLGRPLCQVSSAIGETLTVFHDTMLLLPQGFKERESVQRLRNRSDKEIAAAVGKEPVDLVQEYYTSLLCKALKVSFED